MPIEIASPLASKSPCQATSADDRPPPSVDAKWYAPHLAYTLSKMGMSLCVLGLAEELRSAGVAVNGLWPRTLIATAAIDNLFGGDDAIRGCRKPEIVADAAHAIFLRRARDVTVDSS
jgi:citronellol/citronellal dehydrogenase